MHDHIIRLVTASSFILLMQERARYVIGVDDVHHVGNVFIVVATVLLRLVLNWR